MLADLEILKDILHKTMLILVTSSGNSNCKGENYGRTTRKRIVELWSEFVAGQKMLADFDSKRGNL